MSNNLTRTCRSFPSWVSHFRLANRFSRNEDGSTAIEFGMVALPFIAIMFAIIQTALIFFGNQILETANADTARLIMTGQAKTFDAATYKNSLCSRIKGLMTCEGVSIDVKNYPSFTAVNFSSPIDAEGKLATDTFGFSPGSGGDIVVVRAMYGFPIFVSLFGLDQLVNMAGNKRLLIATAAFRNEPFQ